MYNSKEAMRISTAIQSHATDIRDDIADAIELSIVGRAEVPFLTELSDFLPAVLQQSLARAGLAVNVRMAKIHQKPKVTYQHGQGKKVSCELADLLIVVKYVVPGKPEAKSVFHQVKSAAGVGTLCKIDETQLELLQRWPVLEFGKAATGGPQPYLVRPSTMDFGTYMLMLRAPAQGHVLSPVRPAYGVCPTAWRVADSGPHSVDMKTLPYTLMVQSAILNHLAFQAGEPHGPGGVQPLIDAVYRYIGWQPDPPDEFDGYFNDHSATDQHVFVVIEVRVALGDSREAQSIGEPKLAIDLKKLESIQKMRTERKSKYFGKKERS